MGWKWKICRNGKFNFVDFLFDSNYVREMQRVTKYFHNNPEIHSIGASKNMHNGKSKIYSSFTCEKKSGKQRWAKA